MSTEEDPKKPPFRTWLQLSIDLANARTMRMQQEEIEVAKRKGTKPSELLRLLALNAYQSYSNTLVGNAAPRIKELFQELREPKEGDLVLEVSTAAFMPQPRFREHQEEVLAEAAYIGYLEKHTREAVSQVYARDEPWDAEYEGGPEPTVEVFYIRTLLNGRLHRWHNARFIKVLDEYKFNF
jgi:hypothetical protein